MTRLTHYLLNARIWYDENGQDFTEYALVAGMVAIAGGALFPPVREQISVIFSRLGSTMEQV